MKILLADFKLLLRYFIFWLIICFVDRLVFVLSFPQKLIAWSDLIDIYCHGLLLDLSTVAYICTLPFLLFSLSLFFPKLKIKLRYLDIYTLVVLVFFALVAVINVNIYREWGDKVSKRAIDAFLQSPSGAVASAESGPVFFPLFLGAISIILGYFFYKLLRSKGSLQWNSGSFKHKILVFLLGGVVLFSLIRGGYGRAVLNASNAYFSENTFYNHAAVNTHWALLKGIVSNKSLTKNAYPFYQESEIDKILKPIFAHDADSSVSILKTDRPNVVLIILESFVSDLIYSLNGEKGVCPNFEKLIADGILFTKIYAAGDRSDKGIIGVLSGFPAQGPESIIKYIVKHEEMPAIGQELSAVGYNGSFYHGGQSEFYNVKSYMLTHGISKVVDQSNFGIHEPRTTWGIYDHIVFDRMLKDLNKEEIPFFSSIFTLINHEPYVLKDNYKFGKDSNVNKFKSTAYYTDSILYDFVSQAKEEAWYKNTLFVVLADHGHRLPKDQYEIFQPERFHIPLLFFGDVIKEEYRGKKINRIGNQTDLATTLLTQLKLPTNRYAWSRDLLNPTYKELAFYNSKDAFGIISPKQVLSFDNVGHVINFRSNKTWSAAQNDSLLNLSKAYYQGVYRDFLKY